ncbi:putative RSC complex subunit [Patellaria atrata CBS 101060]|uniref:RSC complex subunit n=1 Tax=Patellaria atrata CBS 101060 TaxID=1346257 RepID=A0A9P4SGN5_9PEZI|nr:putative RSC complex subunit [Patellaria atrata CBS 101060]
MASVQASRAPPQQGGMAPLPPNMTKENIHQMFQKFQQMKSQGVSETDPEYLKLLGILKAVQAKNNLQKMQMQRQIMERQQQAQQNGAAQQVPLPPPTNGVKLSTAATTDASASSPAALPIVTPTSNSNPTPTSTSHQQITDAKPTAQAAANNASTFTTEQIMLLRAQISAFKALSKGMSVPPSLQQQLFPSQQPKKAATPSETIDAANQALDTVNRASSETVAEGAEHNEEVVRKGYETFTSPYELIAKSIGFLKHGRRENRTIVPSIMPAGVDVDKLREERENIIYNRIMSRKAELEKLPGSIGSWDTSKSDSPNGESSLKLRAIIEYKMLCLLPKQRALRQQISREMIHADNLAMTANRAQYRRVKKQSLREARITEKLEKQQRDARETKEKKKHTDFLKSIVSHAEEVHRESFTQKTRQQRLGKLMQTTHSNIEKEEQKRIERTAKQRLQALKANDEETYLKLLGQAKDSRISHLLKQTDGFLNQLASSVKAQQRSAAEKYGDDLPEESSDESELDEEEGEKRTKVDYYEVAHKIKEEVVAQSSNLVGGSLKEYQLKGLQWMLSLYNNKLNGILADEMGLGKTIQSISLITYLIEKKQQRGPYLVIVPLSTLTNWNNEFEKWAPSVSKIVYKGPPNARKQQQQQIRQGNFQVLLTTYEFIIKDKHVLSRVKWVHMIVDEGHRMKNANSKLSSTITQHYHTRYRLILTGTPLQNNLPELWALLNFVLPNIFKSVKSFDEWFNTPFANTGGQDKMELTEEEQLLVIRRLHKVLRPFLLRRLKKDVEKDLPDKQERVIKCNFSSLQAKLYKHLVNHNRLMVSDGKGGRTGMRGLSNMLMQLRKLCNHPFVFEEVEEQMNPGKASNDLLWRTAGKFELLDRILPKFQATNHRVLMFFQMTQIMNIMEDFLRLRGILYLRLDGSTKADDRSELLRLFNAPDSPYFMFLLSTRAGGLGLNLQTADTVIIYDSDWNPHQDLQAQDRAHRIGQKNEVRILRLISSNSVEEKILERANFKLDMDGKVIQAGKFDNKSTNEERDAMLRIMLESAEAAENLEQDEQDDEDLNLIMMRSEAELELFQKMDIERAKNSKYGPDKKYPRLLSEAELPDIYVNDDVPVVEEIEEAYGRGARERTRVKYDDGLTEEQWLEAVDNDEDTIEAAVARKEARKARRAVNKDKRAKGEYDVGDSPAPSRDSSESPPPPVKKRGRKPKIEKRKADEASLDEEPPSSKKRSRGNGRVMETLSKEERATLQAALDIIYETVEDLEEESTDPSIPNRDISGPFIELPPRLDYPDYYQIIAKPICLDQIKKKIDTKKYQSLREFKADVKLLCDNCRQYNEDGSVLYQDANTIEVPIR